MSFKTTLSSPVETIQTGISGSTGWIILNRPEQKNAVNEAMWKALPLIIDQLDKHRDVRTIVLQGAGSDSFSAGADIKEFTKTRSDASAAKEYERLNVAAMQALANAEKPVIAMINGICFGGGLALAVACDLRIASQDATFSLPPARLGLAYPIAALQQLLGVISPPVAKELLFTAKRINALDAMRYGLVNEIVSSDMLKDAVTDICNSISQNAPLTITASKQTINELQINPQNPDTALLERLSGRCFESNDYKEGQAAFLEKRQAVFKGS